MDDALGYTDPERLKLMGAVLAVAAKECQIVIFTCVPERYAFIGEAAVVPLSHVLCLTQTFDLKAMYDYR